MILQLPISIEELRTSGYCDRFKVEVEVEVGVQLLPNLNALGELKRTSFLEGQKWRQEEIS